MKRSFWAGVVVGAGLGYLAKRWWHKQLNGVPRRALGGALPDGVDGVPLALFQATGLEFAPENQIDWFNDARLFPALFEAVEQAQHSIHFDVYIWKPSVPGCELAERVIRKARAGVKVRVLVDPMGSPGFEEELAPRLREAGCEVRFFRPPRRKPLKFWGRNHRKLIVVDGRLAFTGGFGIANEWATGSESTPVWREANVRVAGPVVRQMQQAFAAHWMEVGGLMLPAKELQRARPAGTARSCFVTSMDVKGLSNARWTTHIALAAAKEQLWIANAYFVPPPELVGALCERRREGIDLRLLLPARTDHRWVGALQRSTYRRLLNCGVRIFEYQPTMIHAKTMLVDHRLVVVGSTNLDPLSQHVLEEGSLVVDDVNVARALEQRWLRVRVELRRRARVVLIPPASPPPQIRTCGFPGRQCFRGLAHGPLRSARSKPARCRAWVCATSRLCA